jgi:DNA-binding NtrC family response regulator
VALNHDAIDVLGRYRWPGNIRQLMNFTYAVTALESQKLTPTSERIILDGPTLLSYIPREEGPVLPTVYNGPDAQAGGMSVDEKEMIYKAIRDLKNELDSLKQLVLAGGEPAYHHQLPQWEEDAPEEQEQVEPQDLSLKKSEEELIRRALEKHGGNRKLAADELGMSERTLYRKLPEEFKKKK